MKSIKQSLSRGVKYPHCRCDYRRYRTGYASHHLTTAYYTWLGMRGRCYTKYDSSYFAYGARGVEVCQRWRDSFEDFFSDVGHAPPGTTLDKDIKGGVGGKLYSPETCMWATAQQQAAHRRTSRRYTINGVEKCIAEWARQYGVSGPTIIYRLDVKGMTIKEALAPGRTGVRGYTRHPKYGGFTAQITIDGSTIYLGYFQCELLARQAFEDAYLKYKGVPAPASKGLIGALSAS